MGFFQSTSLYRYLTLFFKGFYTRNYHGKLLDFTASPTVNTTLNCSLKTSPYFLEEVCTTNPFNSIDISGDMSYYFTLQHSSRTPLGLPNTGVDGEGRGLLQVPPPRTGVRASWDSGGFEGEKWIRRLGRSDYHGRDSGSCCGCLDPPPSWLAVANNSRRLEPAGCRRPLPPTFRTPRNHVGAGSQAL